MYLASGGTKAVEMTGAKHQSKPMSVDCTNGNASSVLDVASKQTIPIVVFTRVQMQTDGGLLIAKVLKARGSSPVRSFLAI